MSIKNMFKRRNKAALEHQAAQRALPPKERTLEEVTKEYNQCCLELGHQAHQREIADQRCRSLNVRMAQLEAEAAEAQKREKAPGKPEEVRAA